MRSSSSDTPHAGGSGSDRSSTDATCLGDTHRAQLRPSRKREGWQTRKHTRVAARPTAAALAGRGGPRAPTLSRPPPAPTPRSPSRPTAEPTRWPGAPRRVGTAPRRCQDPPAWYHSSTGTAREAVPAGARRSTSPPNLDALPTPFRAGGAHGSRPTRPGVCVCALHTHRTTGPGWLKLRDLQHHVDDTLAPRSAQVRAPHPSRGSDADGDPRGPVR